MNGGVSNQEISDTMYDLLEEINEDLDYLFYAEDKEEEDMLQNDFNVVYRQFEYLVDLVTDEFEDSIIVITPQEIVSEIAKLDDKLN